MLVLRRRVSIERAVAEQVCNWLYGNVNGIDGLVRGCVSIKKACDIKRGA